MSGRIVEYSGDSAAALLRVFKSIQLCMHERQLLLFSISTVRCKMSHGADEYPFRFPFQPYDVQIELMEAMTKVIDTRAVGMFESPTGTGKTLSIICATLSWIQRHRLDAEAVHSTAIKDHVAVDDEPDWVSAHAVKLVNDNVSKIHCQRVSVFSQRLRNAQSCTRIANSTSTGHNTSTSDGSNRNSTKSSSSAKTRRSVHGNVTNNHLRRPRAIFDAEDSNKKRRISSENDAMYLVQEPSVNEIAMISTDPNVPIGVNDMCNGEEEEDEEEENISKSTRPVTMDHDLYPRYRVIFATRTHTQLTQFVQELRKTCFVSDDSQSAADTVSADTAIKNLPVSVVTLGSRNVMCINDEVRSLPTSVAVADRCNDLLKQKASNIRGRSGLQTSSRREQSCGCPFKNQIVEQTMRDAMLTKLRDVEELSSLGKQLHGCPYFSMRSAVATGAVDLICVPYSVVLHGPTRDALGLTVDDKTIVVFDEAHNIVDTVSDLNSAILTISSLQLFNNALQAYQERYTSRLGVQTAFSIKQLSAVVDGLIRLMENASSEKSSLPSSSRVVTPSSLVFEAKFDNVNLFSLCDFLRTSRLPQKLLGFVDAGFASFDAVKNTNAPRRELDDFRATADDTRRKAKQSIFSVENFLNQLNANVQHGKVAIFAAKNSKLSESYLKYFVLHPGSLFASSVKDARAILLIGGTLSPREAIKTSLLAEISRARSVCEFECGHVVPSENLLGAVISKGFSGCDMEFTYRNRKNNDVIDELGRIVASAADSSPGGVVVFFASYAFMSSVIARWSSTGMNQRLNGLKPLYHEERGATHVWNDFVRSVDKNPSRGSILTAVMGGRLSEGINFSDDLGRVIIVVGMPFANSADVQTAEILKSMPTPKDRGEFLENSCLTVVNQALGRAVRHREDYAAILLCDQRYGRPHTIDKLPSYIRQVMQRSVDTSVVPQMLQDFFQKRTCSRK